MSHVKNSWKCGHARRPYNGLRHATTAEVANLAKHAATQTWRRMAADELRERGMRCPPCRVSDRRALRAATMLAIAAAVLLIGVSTCTARAEGDPCAPYTPADGRTCKPPTKLYFWHGIFVCACGGPGVASR